MLLRNWNERALCKVVSFPFLLSDSGELGKLTDFLDPSGDPLESDVSGDDIQSTRYSWL